MRITVKGVLVFCSLMAGFIAAEVVAASSQNQNGAATTLSSEFNR